MKMQSSGATRREIAASHSVVVTRLLRDCALGRVTQYSRDSSDRTDKPRHTGSPAGAVIGLAEGETRWRGMTMVCASLSPQ